MPSVPIPQQVPIGHAGWGTDFTGNVQMPTDDRTPVNPIMSGLSQAASQAQTALQTSQAANQVTDLQQKQRGMQASLIQAALNSADPAGALKNIIPIANRLNPSYQYDPDIDPATAKIAAMGTLPLGEQPQFQMNTAKANFYNRLAGGGAPSVGTSSPLAGAVSQPQQGAPDSQGGPEAPASVNPLLSDPNTAAALAIFDPAGASALTGVQKLQFDTPQGKANTAEATKTGENLADAQKTYAVAAGSLPRALERFQQLREAVPKASYGLGVTENGSSELGAGGLQTKIAQQFDPETNLANQTLKQASDQGILTELGPQLAGLKGNKFLEGIASGASGLNMADSPEAKIHAIDQLQTQYVANMKSLAAQRRAYGDKSAPTDQQIDDAVAKAQGFSAAPQTAATQAQTAVNNPRSAQPKAPPMGTIKGGYRYTGGDPSKPESWKATK
jgi:hypothetical protein